MSHFSGYKLQGCYGIPVKKQRRNNVTPETKKHRYIRTHSISHCVYRISLHGYTHPLIYIQFIDKYKRKAVTERVTGSGFALHQVTARQAVVQ
jgi:phage replication-related protein YjqB (UPF0714/DUF867 family)